MTNQNVPQQRKTKRELYLCHIEKDDNSGNNIEGCFYCGGNHPSDCCQSDDRDHFWDDDEED